MNSKVTIGVGFASVLALILIPISTQTFAAEINVDITVGSSTKGDQAFSPNPVEAKVGDTVTWTNQDSQPHTVRAGSGEEPGTEFDSGLNNILVKGETFSHKFETEGAFPYFCELHPTMTGMVNVAAAADEQPTGPTMTLQGTSTSGNFQVSVDWTSNDIGKENIFDIKIMNADGSMVSGATYDFMFFRGEQHLTDSHREDQTAMQQKYTFSEQGSYTLVIEDINGSGTSDRVSIAMQVTPEFPAGLIALMAAAFGAVIIAARIKKLHLPRF